MPKRRSGGRYTPPGHRHHEPRGVESVSCYFCEAPVFAGSPDFTPFRHGTPGNYELEVAHRKCVELAGTLVEESGGTVDLTTDPDEVRRLIDDPNS
jgi:hypothetical protein